MQCSFKTKYTNSLDSWRRCSSSESRVYNKEFEESGTWSPKPQNSVGSDEQNRAGNAGQNSAGSAGSSYYLNTDCVLHIPRDSEKRELTVRFSDLYLEYDKFCSYDFVEVSFINTFIRLYCRYMCDIIDY